MLVAVIPSSIYALTMGCKAHKRYRIFYWGVAGLILMSLAVLLAHELIGETGEKLLTLVGALCVVIAHWGNFKRCQQHKCASK